MSLRLVRVDDRLIHGQVVAVWIGQLLLLPLLSASAVFAVVPDGEASDDSRAEILPPESRR